MKLNGSKLCVFIVILLLFTFIFTSQAREIDSEKWFGIVRSYYNATSMSGTETYKGWEEGAQQEFGLTLKKLKFTYELLIIDQSDKKVAMIFLFKMVGLCYNKDGDKKRIEMVRTVMLAIDKGTEKIIDVKVLDQVGPTVIHGWDGRDV
ncbi:MAG: hypothetical protein IMZ43_09655 [Thermoplasmata archaeon]|nr:hypothetical protein [Thermoplasmata archaeon]